MSNLETAKAAIKAELSHAKKGIDFYHSRIEALEKMLSQFENFHGKDKSSAAASKGTTKRGPKGKAVQIEKEPKFAKKTKAAKESSGANGLPFTGGDFWSNLVIDQPRSASEVLDAAIATLKFVPSKTQIQKLTNRMTFALNSLVKTHKIQDSGSGRERRFFKA